MHRVTREQGGWISFVFRDKRNLMNRRGFMRAALVSAPMAMSVFSVANAAVSAEKPVKNKINYKVRWERASPDSWNFWCRLSPDDPYFQGDIPITMVIAADRKLTRVIAKHDFLVRRDRSYTLRSRVSVNGKRSHYYYGYVIGSAASIPPSAFVEGRRLGILERPVTTRPRKLRLVNGVG